MKKNVNKLYDKNFRAVYATAFSVIEIVLISLILFSSVSKIAVCYATIVVAFLFSLPYLGINIKRNVLIVLALFFTLIADFFLVIEYGLTGKYVFQCLGVSTFFLVQFCYFLYIDKTNAKSIFLYAFLTRAIVSAFFAGVSVLVLGGGTNYLSLISVVYFVWLIFNIIFCFRNFKKRFLLLFGLIFFALCDVFVGLQSAHGVFFEIPQGFIYKIIFPPFNAIWLFYGISQTLIVLYMILQSERF